MEDLREKVAVITGAASGIGYAMAGRFDAIRARRFLVTTELDMARQAVTIRRDEVEGAPPLNPLV
ncbi:MAG TPA: hypothetical protein VF441_10095 [Acidimicrobiia bacterium]